MLLAVITLSGCHVTPYQRTLPEWVQRVYIPMAKNQTAEPGLEELITKAFQTEILADGRLELTQKSKSNAVLQVTLHDYKEVTSHFESDNVKSATTMEMKVGLDLFDPKDLRNPIGSIPAFTVKLPYSSDYRNYQSELDVDARERLGETTALRLLSALMSNAKMTTP